MAGSCPNKADGLAADRSSSDAMEMSCAGSSCTQKRAPRQIRRNATALIYTFRRERRGFLAGRVILVKVITPLFLKVNAQTHETISPQRAQRCMGTAWKLSQK